VARDPSALARLLSLSFWARVWTRAAEDEVFNRAAQLSYYFLFALFPLLFFLITLFGYFSSAGIQLHSQLISYLAEVMPSAAVQLVAATIDEVTHARGGGKLSFGLLVALWAASSGMNAMGQALNVAYDVPETRSWWQVRLISIALTVALALLIISALLIVLYGRQIGHFLAAAVDLGSVFQLTWTILQWPISLAFVFIGFALVYQFAPNAGARRHGKRLPADDYRRRWVSPGVIIAVLLWLLVSLGFRLYLHFFNSYSATYGSLGALIIMMLWLYLTGAAILFGGEINCEWESSDQAAD